MLLVVAFVLVPFLFWRATWFGRRLTDEETGQYLADTKHPRKAQHALVQLGERILRGDPGVKRWYPQVQELAGHSLPEIRATAAWVMGQDNQSREFHAALTGLLGDPDPLVRRNAALSLVRFGDASGMTELRAMLQPYALLSPSAGRLSIRLKEGNPVNPGTLLGRLQRGDEASELRSPLPGAVGTWLVVDGAAVSEDEPLVLLSPGEEQVWEALRALYLVGEESDLLDVERFARGVEGMPEKVRAQAQLTADAIRRRASSSGNQSGTGRG